MLLMIQWNLEVNVILSGNCNIKWQLKEVTDLISRKSWLFLDTLMRLDLYNLFHRAAESLEKNTQMEEKHTAN